MRDWTHEEWMEALEKVGDNKIKNLYISSLILLNYIIIATIYLSILISHYFHL